MAEEQKPKHTPGPWVNVGTVGFSTGIASRDNWVALVYGKNVNPSSDADAALIAASPELLEVLRLFMDIWGSGDSNSPSKRAQKRRADMWEKANAAVAKAEGRNA